MATTYNQSDVTYNSPVHLYGGRRAADFFRRAEYSVVIRNFTDAANGDFSPGNTIAFIDNPHHLAWTEYINEVGEAFFSLSQDDAKAALLNDQQSLVNSRPHMQIYRNGVLVWGGWLGEIDETSTDVVFYGYSYLSGLHDLITDWNVSYSNQTIAAIIADLWGDAKAKSDSRVAWMTTGTIESPVTTSDGTTPITMPLYKANYKRILTAMKELTAYSISDTTNHVVFEITPDGIFNLWKDRKQTISNVKSSFGHGNVRSFRRIRRPVHRRTRLISVGSSPTDVTLQDSVIDSSLENTMGRSEEPIYLSFVRDADELDRVTKIRGKRASRVDSELFISFYKDRVVPYRAVTNPDYRVGDLVRIELDHGTSNLSETKVVVGQQVVYYRKAENVRILLGDRL